MSGHSKWSKVKHQKAVTDVTKAANFTKAARGIIIAVKEGGGIIDPDLNFRLRLAIDKAKSVNMPKVNIDRLLDRTKTEKNQLENIIYEAYGPGNAALIIEAVTDNKLRAISQIKNCLDKGGGRLADQGSVKYLFHRCGVLTILKSSYKYDDMMEYGLEGGADEVHETEDCYEFYCDPARLSELKDYLSAAGLNPDNTEIILKAKNEVIISGNESESLQLLTDRLEDLDDVQKVFTNTVN